MLAERIKKLFNTIRKPTGDEFSAREIAELAGISNTYLSQLLNGERENPSVSVVTGLAKAFGVSVSYLLGEDASAAALEDSRLQYAMADETVRAIALAATDLTPQAQREALDWIQTQDRRSAFDVTRGAKRALVVEDDQDAMSFTTVAIERAGYQVTQAFTGHQALDALRERPAPDLVILDLHMPGIAGSDILMAIREHNDLSVRSVPVIVVSAHRELASEIGALADLVLMKPVSLERLSGSIEHMNRGKG